MAGSGEVEAAELPGGIAICLCHEGPYQSLFRSFEALQEAVASKDLVPSGPPWESYVIGPPTETDASKWRTELYQPVEQRNAGVLLPS